MPWSRVSRLHRGDAIDALTAAACAGSMLIELARLPPAEVDAPMPAATVAIVLIALPVAVRHRYPVVSFGAALTILFALVSVASVHDTVGFASVLCGYTLAQLRGRTAAILGGIVAVPVVLSILQIFSPHPLLSTDTLRNMALVVVPLALGVAAHDRRAATDALLQRAVAAEHSREEEALRRVGEERLRIARDVHDVVAHAMVAINIQAGVGAHLLDRDPDQARSTLREIKRVSGDALGDLRAMLGLLRNEDDVDAPVRPTVGVADLDHLRPGLESAGVDLEIFIDPAIADLPVTIDVAGYRIAQEALTNVIRHAGPTSARVRIERRRGSVLIEIEDDGGAGGDLGRTGSGNGLRGMRERALAVGGTLEAGPRRGTAERGWRVTAVLPATTTSLATAASRPVTAESLTANSSDIPGYPMIRVLLVDDQALVRAGFRALLDAEPDITVVGEAVDGAEAAEAATRLRPDVVLMDVRMPRVDGLEATVRITSDPELDGTRVIVLTTFEQDEYVFSALRAGAAGFLLKDIEPEALIAAVRTVHDGDALLAPRVTTRLIEAFLASAHTSPEPAAQPAPSATLTAQLALLTPREREVLTLVGRGWSNHEIATELVLSPLTVKTHMSRLFLKLAARDRAQLVVVAYETGIVSRLEG